MVGGGSLIALLLLMIFVPPQNKAGVIYVGTMVYWGSFICNNPHFMISYQLLYSGYGAKLHQFSHTRPMWWRYVNVGILVPAVLLLLLGIMTYDGVTHASYQWLGYGTDAMFFFVGWHYMKQAFGMFIMLSALRKVYYSALQRRIMLWNSYATWFFAWGFPHPPVPVDNETLKSIKNAIIIPLTTVSLPAWLVCILGLAVLFTTIGVFAVLWQVWVKEGKRPPISAMIGYFSMYYLFAFIFWMHPLWIMVAPFFHSLQYLFFVIAYKRGHARKELNNLARKLGQQPAMHDAKKIRGRHERFYAYAFLLGLSFFLIIPLCIDLYAMHLPRPIPAGFFMTAFSIFINIHHYFIDNVIWRKENSDVGDHLFQWSR